MKCSFYANGERAVDQKMALELFKAKALIGGLRKELAELRFGIDNLKVRSYELGQRELHDMALALLNQGGDG